VTEALPPLDRPAGSGRPDRQTRQVQCDLPADLTVTMRPIGVVRSPYVWREEAPRQATVGEPVRGTIILHRTLAHGDGRTTGTQNLLHDLAGFSHLIVLSWFHHSHGWRPQVVPPRDHVKRGLLATRSPDRPNPIGLSIVRIIDIYGVRIDVSGLDLLDGTPVLDLKPYLPAYDSFPDARTGWVGQLATPGPDHRNARSEAGTVVVDGGGDQSRVTSDE
jgi:tRNA (adenine37-N6)-methyltransferase